VFTSFLILSWHFHSFTLFIFEQTNVLYRSLFYNKEISYSEYLQELKKELKASQLASENRLAAAQDVFNRDLNAAQVELKRDLSAAQVELKRDLNAAQAELKRDLAASHIDLKKDLKKEIFVILAGAACGLAAFGGGCVTIYLYFLPSKSAATSPNLSENK
jgi:hypothetical protein